MLTEAAARGFRHRYRRDWHLYDNSAESSAFSDFSPFQQDGNVVVTPVRRSQNLNKANMGSMVNETVVAEPIASICTLGYERHPVAIEEVELTPTAAAPATSTTQNKTSSSSSSSSLRRLACDACRARKVRCDRQDPPCSRCAKVGVTCRYSSRSKPTPSKMDLSRFLITLNNRLSEYWLYR